MECQLTRVLWCKTDMQYDTAEAETTLRNTQELGLGLYAVADHISPRLRLEPQYGPLIFRAIRHPLSQGIRT